MRFSLSAKLVVGFGGLLLVLLGLGGAGLSWVDRLGDSSAVILRENYRSVRACEQMQEALERLDSGALFALLGEVGQGRELARVHGPEFRQALATELDNITLPGEGERAQRIGVLFADYEATLARILAADEPVEVRRRLYFDVLLPRFRQIKGLAEEVLHMNQASMEEASVAAQRLARHGAREMLALVVAGTLLAVLCVVFLSRAILGPLRRLTESVREIEAGHLDLAVEADPRDEIGQLATAFNAMARHLRELRRSDRARLLRAQKTSHLAIDSLADNVFLLSPEGGVELANRAAGELLGIAAGAPVPAAERGWLDPLLAAASQATSQATGKPPRIHGPAFQRFVAGEERFYLPQATAIRDEELQLVGITVVLSDVTELRKADELKSDLAATVSHELLTPVTSLGMAVHILLEERFGALTPRQTELLVGAREDVERLRRLIEGILDVSRLESGRSLMDLHPLPVRQLVETAVAPLRAAYQDRGVELRVTLAPELGPVLADAARAPIVLSNLLTNALKHTPPGGQAEVRAEAGAGVARIAVADSGPGLAAAERERIFEKFYQVTARDRATGAGLGLAIAREIVAAHGGRIWCESTPGHGATFLFELPLA